jgi:hypothetical protein
MGASGTTTINFGAFPGGSDTSAVITGQASILAGSLVEAWLMPVATADHTADEHLVETIRVVAGNIAAGTGFTIYAMNTSDLYEFPLGWNPGTPKAGSAGKGTRLYGLWTVGWVWN